MFSLFLHVCLFLLPPFWFHTQKGEDCLFHAAEWSPSHSLHYHDRCSVYTKLEMDPIGFLFVLINPSMAGIQSLIQPTELLKVVPYIFHRAWKPSHHSFIGSRPIILNLELSQAVRGGTLLSSQSLVSSSWHITMAAPLVQ
jgi:hypothetical protein